MVQLLKFTLGRVGITLNVNWSEPEVDSDPAYVEAANNDLHFNLGWFAKPILVDGKYPDVMREKVYVKYLTNRSPPPVCM